MSDATQPKTKRCSKCRHVKLANFAEFAPMNTKTSGMDPYCRMCRRAYSRRLYATSEVRRTKTAAANARRREENWDLVADYLKEHPCVDCGETDLRVLDFDHIDREMKTLNVSRLMSGSTYRLKVEMAKCAIRCANCHRRRTWVDLGWRHKGE